MPLLRSSTGRDGRVVAHHGGGYLLPYTLASYDHFFQHIDGLLPPARGVIIVYLFLSFAKACTVAGASLFASIILYVLRIEGGSGGGGYCWL